MAESVRARLQPTQVLAGLIGLAFLALGVIGFVHTGFDDFAGQGHGMLWGVFAINPLHNVIHLLFGVVGVLLALTSATARLYGWVVFAGYAALLVWGLMLVGLTSSNPVSELGNPLHLNVADNWLHLGIAVLGLIVAIVPLRRKVVETVPAETVPAETVPAETAPVETAPVATTTAPVTEPRTDALPVQHNQAVTQDKTATQDKAATQDETAERRPRGLHRLHRRSTAH